MLAGLQAVVELAEELVEQVSLGLVVPVSGGAAGVVVAAGAGEARSDPSAQIGPTAARRRFLICRCNTTVFLPLARVIGADPAKALSPRASAKRVRSSPISASTRAPASFPRPGKLVMISASGCCSKWAIAASASSSAAAQAASNWRSSALSWMPIAFSTTGGWCR